MTPEVIVFGSGLFPAFGLPLTLWRPRRSRLAASRDLGVKLCRRADWAENAANDLDQPDCRSSLGLPPARNEVAVERDLEVPMPDGTILLADHDQPPDAKNRWQGAGRRSAGGAGVSACPSSPHRTRCRRFQAATAGMAHSGGLCALRTA